MEQESCKTCRFYKPRDPVGYGDPKFQREQSLRGFCTKNAPIAVHPRLSTEAQVDNQSASRENYIFPVVPKELWCGNYADCGLFEEEMQPI